MVNPNDSSSLLFSFHDTNMSNMIVFHVLRQDSPKGGSS